MSDYKYQPGELLVFGKHLYLVMAINTPFRGMYRLKVLTDGRVVDRNIDSVHKALKPATIAQKVLFGSKV
jgi:hypothetical protein